jgi:Zn-dependent protease with chaperone function
MYVSYGLNVAVGIAAFIISHVFIGLDLIPSFIAIIGALIITFPFVLRWARNIYINMFVSYDPNAAKEK